MKKNPFKFFAGHSRRRWLLILVVSLAVIAVILVVAFFVVRHNRQNIPHHSSYLSYENTYPIHWLSENITLRRHSLGSDSFLYNEKTRKRLSPQPLHWVGTNGDTLAVVAATGRRAFFNRFTGEQVLPFDYTRAWLFSEGVAAVTDTADNLFFINKKGERAIPQTYRYSPSMRYEGYQFHNGYCIMNQPSDGGADGTPERMGMIDREGGWCLPPVWDKIIWRQGYWELRRNDSILLIDTALRTILPKMRAIESRLYGDSNILVEIPHRPLKLYTMQGRLLTEKVFAYVTPLLYRADHQVDYSNDTDYSELIPSACFMYTNMGGDCGLMDGHGRILTDALYREIKAVDRDLFCALLTYYPNNIYVLLGSDGKEIR